jgi:hypothetical protein
MRVSGRQSVPEKWELAGGGQCDAGPNCTQPKSLAAVQFQFLRQTPCRPGKKKINW